ncbi:hypothetical protein Tco_0688316 [Tanacetum coccineum]
MNTAYCLNTYTPYGNHYYLRLQEFVGLDTVKGYTKDIVHDFEQRLDIIFGRHVNRVHVLDFAGLTKEMGQTLADRIRMVYFGAKGQALFTTHAWRRLFKIPGLLLGGARRRMTWRQFILALGLHTFEEMAEDGFEAYWLGSGRAWVASGPERQSAAAAGAPEVTEGALDVEEGDQAFPATIQAH